MPDKGVMISTPDFDAGLDEDLPDHLVSMAAGPPGPGRHEFLRVRCPRCGGGQTGYYEVGVYRMRGIVTREDGEEAGDRIGSVVDEERLLTDKKGKAVWDCCDCGYRFTVTPDFTPLFLGAYI